MRPVNKSRTSKLTKIEQQKQIHIHGMDDISYALRNTTIPVLGYILADIIWTKSSSVKVRHAFQHICIQLQHLTSYQ